MNATFATCLLQIIRRMATKILAMTIVHTMLKVMSNRAHYSRFECNHDDLASLTAVRLGTTGFSSAL